MSTHDLFPIGACSTGSQGRIHNTSLHV